MVQYAVNNCYAIFQSAEEWKIVFFIASAIYLLGAVIYAFCASGERQPWAIEEEIQNSSMQKSKEGEDRYSGLYDFNHMEQLKLPRPKLHHNDPVDFWSTIHTTPFVVEFSNIVILL